MWPTETSSGRTLMVYAALGTKKQQATEEKSNVKNAVSADGLNPVACESTRQDPELRAPRRSMQLERLSPQQKQPDLFYVVLNSFRKVVENIF